MNRIIIDVREPSEYASGYVEGAINIPLQELVAGSKKLTDIPKDSELIVYCRSGNRSEIARNILSLQGYKNIVNGINAEHIQKKY